MLFSDTPITSLSTNGILINSTERMPDPQKHAKQSLSRQALPSSLLKYVRYAPIRLGAMRIVSSKSAVSEVSIKCASLWARASNSYRSAKQHTTRTACHTLASLVRRKCSPRYIVFTAHPFAFYQSSTLDHSSNSPASAILDLSSDNNVPAAVVVEPTHNSASWTFYGGM